MVNEALPAGGGRLERRAERRRPSAGRMLVPRLDDRTPQGLPRGFAPLTFRVIPDGCALRVDRGWTFPRTTSEISDLGRAARLPQPLPQPRASFPSPRYRRSAMQIDRSRQGRCFGNSHPGTRIERHSAAGDAQGSPLGELMFVRWQRYRSRALNREPSDERAGRSAVLIETVRIDDRPRQKHAAFLGSVSIDGSDRAEFWYGVTMRLDWLGNLLSPQEREQIGSAIAKRVEGRLLTEGELRQFEQQRDPAA